MNIQNKIVHFLGDSITQGACVTPQTSFVGLFKSAYPNAEINNYGVGGTRIAPQTNPSQEPIWDYNYIARAKDMKENADLIVIFGGTNDFGHGDAPLGNMQSRNDGSFYASMYTLFENLLIKYPYAKFLVLTPLHRLDETNARGLTLKDYVVAIREMAEYFSFPVLDLYKNAGINPCVASVQTTLMPDGLHPNAEGHRRLFELIDSYIKYSL